jgi:hypothetical protein
MRTIRALRNVTAALAGVILLAGTTQAFDAELPWNQEDVTRLAKQLKTTVNGLIQQGEFEERAAGFSPKALENYLLIEDLKQLERYSKVLVSQLEAGQGREDTAGLFRRIQTVGRDLEVGKQASPILEGAGPEIDKVRGFLGDLKAYYQPRTPPVAAPPDGKNAEN